MPRDLLSSRSVRSGLSIILWAVVASGGCNNSGRFADDGAEDAGGDPITPDLHDGGEAPDANCASVSAEATLERAPVDIIWLVDNSSSMEPAVTEVRRGLNDFAALIAESGLEYRVIMLSLRNEATEIDSGGTRYPVCIPQPLAGDDHCGNSDTFFHSNVDLKSTQPLEQFLGTLAQSSGYAEGESRGGEPWREQLRDGASKSIVVVTDDNSRLSASQFETFAGGANPNNPNVTLPQGVLGSDWDRLFEGYTFHGIYGYDESNPGEPCTYPSGGTAEASGETYETLVERTGGVQASICDGSAAWGPFFEDVASRVVERARIACELAIPAPPAGMTLNPRRVNVVVRSGSDETTLGKVANEEECPATGGGWYYDNEASPTRVILCPDACEDVQEIATEPSSGLDVQFGCATQVI